MKKYSILILGLIYMMTLTYFTSCKKDEKDPDVIASFFFEIDNDDYKKVKFTNASQNFSALAWDFGDNATSTEVNPVHIYAEIGAFVVKLTATSLDGKVTDVFTATVTLTDPNAELTKLVGDVSKTWKLLRDVSTGVYPCEVGPWDHSQIWWAMGYNNDELANRPCMLNDEWTFGRDGSMVFNANGDYWAEGGVYEPANICASTDNMVGVDGDDLSAWGSGNHTFELTTGTNPTLKVIGPGAYIGLSKLGNGEEVKVPQQYVQYNIISLTDGNVDTLIVEGRYQWDINDPGGYWRFVLVHYDNPNEEPPIPTASPVANFTMVVNGMTITCTNTTQFGLTYLWDFGDGNTATSTDATHTYAEDGFYTITLTATNNSGSGMAYQNVFLTENSPALTDDLLQGDPWKIVVGEKTIFVGPALGASDWWAVPKGFLSGEGTGGDDWSCMVNDEFTFSTGGIYTYEANGDVRNDGYFGSPNGCMAEAALTGNALYFASGVHTYELTPASGSDRAIITLTNGLDRAAFIGFYKGYYGGENGDGGNPPNGGNLTNRYEVMAYAKNSTKEYILVSVDITADHSGTAAWSVILER